MSRQSTEVVILGLPVTTLSMGGVIQTIAGWIERKQSRRVCACDVHSVVRALDDERHGHALGTADLLLPDGVPLVWVGRFRGNKHMQRVCGPDLLGAFVRNPQRGWRQPSWGRSRVSEILIPIALLVPRPGPDRIILLALRAGPATARQVAPRIVLSRVSDDRGGNRAASLFRPYAASAHSASHLYPAGPSS